MIQRKLKNTKLVCVYEKGDMRKSKFTLDNLICAIVTGIPMCCIKWQILKGQYLNEDAKAAHWNGSAKDIMELRYIPCPECIKKGNFVDVWICHLGIRDCRRCVDGGFRDQIKHPRKYKMKRVSETRIKLKTGEYKDKKGYE